MQCGRNVPDFAAVGFDAFVLAAATLAAAIAGVAGFGVGSILTPVFGVVLETKAAVAAVAIPHITATFIRFWTMRSEIDRRALWRFGVPSAAGGLAGALLHVWIASPWLTVLFGSLLLFVAASEFSGLARRMAFHGALAWFAGALSGLLGGLVGNQGGIRSAALMGFDMPRRTFVATATAAGVIVDLARVPVYFATESGALASNARTIAIATAGAIAGTFFGTRLLARIPEAAFRPLVAALLAVLGAVMFAQGVRAL